MFRVEYYRMDIEVVSCRQKKKEDVCTAHVRLGDIIAKKLINMVNISSTDLTVKCRSSNHNGTYS